jgi:TolA-binding protein
MKAAGPKTGKLCLSREMKPQLILFLIVGLLLLFQPGCFWFTSKGEGEELQNEVVHLKDRISQMESETAEKQAYLTEMIDRARGEVDKLETTLTKATRILSRNSADFGADMEMIKNRLREVNGTLAEIRHDLEESKKQVALTNQKVQQFALSAGLDIPVDASTVPTDAAQHFKLIETSYGAGRYGETRSLSTLFLQRHPQDARAENAQLYIARSYMQQKRWAKALGPLRTFTEKYPKSKNTPEALYEMARAFYSLGDCTDARILIEALTARHKGSEYAKKAKELSISMKKNKSRCKS